MLVIVAAGVLAYGFHDLQEARFLPGLGNLAFDVSETVPPDSWYGTLLKGTINFQPNPTVLQAVVWVLYLVPTLAVFLAPGRVAPTQAAPKEPQSDDSAVAPVAQGGSAVGGSSADADGVRDGARRAGDRSGGDEG
jgi:high-affinity iron transporter